MLASNFQAEHVEAARRELARRSFPDFCGMVDIPTVPVTDAEDEDRFSVMRLSHGLVDHHQLLCSRLQALEAGLIPNLMVLMPPGSAKSTYVDVLFVPWFMARKARRNVILASYASDITRKQGRRARQLIKSQPYRNLLGPVLSAESSAADEWALDNGSEFMGGGILSGLTGNRAGLGISDDLIKGREAAESQTIRDKTWEAYIDDFCSRLIPGAPQVMILTRWHEDDPAGRILPEGWDGESGRFGGRDGRIWEVLCLPAIADRSDDPLGRKIGETLWPEWFNHEHWAPFQRNARTWSSLYQQKPAPDEGTFFQRSWFNEWTELPKVRVYGTSDYAVTDGGGDWTVHRVWGIDAEDNIYRLAGWRGQTPADQWIEAKLDLIEKHKPHAWFGEAGVIQKAVEPMLLKRMRERKVRCRLEWVPSIHDKPTRARGFQARASMGSVFFEAGADLGEFLVFPAGKHDDEVDTASLMGRVLDQVHPAIVPLVDPKKPRDIWATREPAADWKTA